MKLKRLTLFLVTLLMMFGVVSVALASAETPTVPADDPIGMGWNLMPVFGTIDMMSDDSLTIWGMDVAVTDETWMADGLAVGDWVMVWATVDETWTQFTAVYVIPMDWDGASDEYFLYLEGTASNVSADSVTVSNTMVAINDYTAVHGDLVDGSFVYLSGLALGDDGNVALSIEAYDEEPEPVDYVYAYGAVTSISDTQLVIDEMSDGEASVSMTFDLDEETMFSETVVEGDMVYVYGVETEANPRAVYVEKLDDTDHGETYWWWGVVTAVSADSITFTTDPTGTTTETLTAAIDDNTYISVDAVEVGDEVWVETVKATDDTYTATYIEVIEQQGEYESVIGKVTAIDDTSVTIEVEDAPTRSAAARTYIIDDNTFMWMTPEVDDEVLIEAMKNDAGDWVALYIEIIGDNGGVDFAEYMGEVTAIATGTLTIDDQVWLTNAETEYEGDNQPEVGDVVYAFGMIVDGNNVAQYIYVYEDGDWDQTYFDVEGTLDAFDDTSLTVDGEVISMTENTWIDGTLEVGADVYVTGMIDGDSKVADYVLVKGDDNDPIGIGSWTEALGPIEAYEADASITVSGTVFTIGDYAVIEGNPAIGLTAFVFGVPSEDGSSVEAIYIEVLDEENMSGVVDSISAGGIVVNGQTLSITGDTRIDGNIVVGEDVYVGMRSSSRAAVGQALYITTNAPSAPTAVTLSGTSADAPAQLALLVLVTAAAVLTVATRIAWTRDEA